MPYPQHTRCGLKYGEDEIQVEKEDCGKENKVGTSSPRQEEPKRKETNNIEKAQGTQNKIREC